MDKKSGGYTLQDMAEALTQVGSTMLLTNRDLGCAVALTKNGQKFTQRAHAFKTKGAFNHAGALSKKGLKEIKASGIVPGMTYDNQSAAARLIARGAITAALSSTLFLGMGVSNAHANLGYTYFGGTNPLGDAVEPGARPAFVDIDKDGDMDCFIGNSEGVVCFYENTSQGNEISFVHADYEQNPLSSVTELDWSAPTFVDIDGDGDMDCFIGHEEYQYQAGFVNSEERTSVSFLENIGSPTEPVFNWNGVITNTRKAALDYNPLTFDKDTHAAPTFADIDGDGDMDAFVGGEGGYIYHYENVTGEAQGKGPVAPIITFNYKGLLVFDSDKKNGGFPIQAFYGGATPHFADIDGDGDLDLFVGNKYGTIEYYENTGDKMQHQFTWVPTCQRPLRAVPGTLSAPAVVDIDGDGLLDLFSGASSLFAGIGARKDDEYNRPLSYTNMSIRYYRNVGTTTDPDLRSRGDNPFNLGPGAFYPAPAIGDIDQDGDLDVLMGGFDIFSLIDDSQKDERKFIKGTFGDPVAFYENVGSVKDPLFAKHTMENSPWNERPEWYLPIPAMADLDGDGAVELYVGHTDNWRVKPSNNTKDPIIITDPVTATGAIDGFNFITDTEKFEEVENNPFAEIDLPRVPSPAFVDIDGDGDMDAFVGGYFEEGQGLAGNVHFFLNEGTPITPAFTLVEGEGNPLTGTLTLGPPKMAFADVDRDGDFDLALGTSFFAVRRNGEQPDWACRYFENVGTKAVAEFVEREGDANPFDAINQEVIAAIPALADLDGDNDLDAIFGDYFGKVFYFRYIKDADEAAAAIQDHGWELCFVESAKPQSSLWNSLVESCKHGAQKVKDFFSPS